MSLKCSEALVHVSGFQRKLKNLEEADLGFWSINT